MNQVYKTLPDNRPITSICVVEDADKCPKGYVVVSKTYDQDSDADLWRESGFFGKKCTRYLCISKTEGTQDYTVESICIINEKEKTPKGYKTITKTIDSEQKAWKRKQLCYKFAQTSSAQTCVTDIIVLSKMKKAPEGFILSGEINGMTMCYKIEKPNININGILYPQVPYVVLPFNPSNNNNSHYHNYGNHPCTNFGNEPGKELQEAKADTFFPLQPFRPAPKPPLPSYATISGYNGLEGVPFILNPKLNFSDNIMKRYSIPKPKAKAEVDQEFSYEFRIERQT